MVIVRLYTKLNFQIASTKFFNMSAKGISILISKVHQKRRVRKRRTITPKKNML